MPKLSRCGLRDTVPTVRMCGLGKSHSALADPRCSAPNSDLDVLMMAHYDGVSIDQSFEDSISTYRCNIVLACRPMSSPRLDEM